MWGAMGLLAAGAAMTAIGGCSLLDTRASYRFRMTAEVQTKWGLRRGSSVYEVIAVKNGVPLLPEEGVRDWGVRGQAVVVNLPDGPLFLLMKVGVNQGKLAVMSMGEPLGDFAYMSMTAFDPAFRNDIVESAQRIERGDGIRSPADVSRHDWPMMVRFRDLNVPKSVEAVDADAIGMKRVWVETTKDPVTTGIQKRFPPWFSRYLDYHLDGTSASAEYVESRDLAAHMSPSSFGTELNNGK